MKVVGPTDQQLEIRGRILDWVSERADIARGSVSLTMPLYEVGLSSADIVELTGELGEHYDLDLPPDTVFEFPSIALLAKHIASRLAPEDGVDSRTASQNETTSDEPIAVIGLGCRFPAGVNGPDALWSLLVDGRDVIGRVPSGRWDHETGSPEVAELVAGTAGVGGFLDDIAAFDPAFFGIAPNEAKVMDPQQRIALEVAVECLDHAGIARETLGRGTTGVFMGATSADYLPDDLAGMDGWSTAGASLGVVANRISYALGTRGPTMTVDTACSSSLVAVHLAVQSLRAGDCDLALAGGVNALLSPAVSIAFTRAGVLAGDGRCKTFDAAADGYTRSEGCGMVALKRLSDAVRDGDRVLAVVRGSAVGSNGHSNGLMAPHPVAQEELLRNAYRDARVDPGEVDFVEAHGTGTALGDAVELTALQAVMTEGRSADRPLRLGAVKTNLGHLEAAAGIAGLIKTVLALWHESLPRNLHYAEPNPKLRESAGALEVVREQVAWPRGSRPRTAGVSSFGFGGTNAHVVVEEAPRTSPPRSGRTRHGLPPVVMVSASSTDAVRREAATMLDVLDRSAAPHVDDLAHTVTLRRTHGPVRAAVAAEGDTELREALEAVAAGKAHAAVVTDHVHDDPAPVFVFSGQGSQHVGMARELLDEPVFADVLDELEPVIAEESGFSLLDVLNSGDEHALDPIDVVQPTLFAVQVALAETWRAYGVTPAAVIGHSMGEVAAAVVAGAVSPTDGARITCRRSRALAGISGRGAMAMVAADSASTTALIAEEGLGEEVTIGVVPSPVSTVVSGSVTGVERLIKVCAGRGVDAVRVQVDVASHSSQVDEILDGIRAALADIEVGEPIVPLYSTVTGGRHRASMTADYWVDNLRQPVLLANAVGAAVDDGRSVFVEISPHPVLVRPLTDTLAGRGGRAFGTLHRERRADVAFAAALARLHCLGADVRWPSTMTEGRLVSLPPRAWHHRRYWRERRSSVPTLARDGHPLLGTVTVPADAPGTRIWSTTLDPGTNGRLAAHRVGGRDVLTASYVLTLLTAAATEYGHERPSARAVTFHSPVAVDGPVDLQVLCRRDASSDVVDARVFHRPSGGSDWTVAASARLEPGRSEIDPPSFDATGEELTGSALYDALAACGVEYQGELRCVDVVRLGGRTAVAALSQVRDGDGGPNPVAVDGAVQVAGTVLLDSSGTAVVAAVDAWTILRPDAGPVRHVHAVRRDVEPTVVDVVLSDDTGPVALGAGVRFATSGPAGESRVSDLRGLTYRLDWQPATAAPTRPEQETWLLLGADNGLLDTLRQQGVRCSRLRGEPSAEEVAEELRSAGPFDRVVSLVPLPVQGAEPQDALRLVRDAAAVLRAVCEAGGRTRLHYVTHHAVRTDPDDPETVHAAQAAVWGFGRSAALEHPDHWGGTLDVADTDTAVVAQALLRGLVGSSSVTQLAHREGEHLQPRLVRTVVRPSEAATDGGTHLVVGGTGRLGPTVVRELAESGAACVVVASRRGGFGLPEEEVEHLRARGTQLVAVSLDVSDPEAVAAVFDRFGADLPPLRRVYHCAFSESVVAIDELTDAQWRAMFAGKVFGIDALRRRLAEHAGADVVCFSSTTGVLGSVGLAHYAAASTYLDALAGPGVRVVDLGPVADGFADGEYTEQVRASGLGFLDTATIRAVVRHLAGPWPEHPVVVVDADWRGVDTSLRWATRSPVTADLVRQGGETVASATVSTDDLVAEVRSASPEDRADALLRYLRHIVAEALGTPAEELPDEQDLYQIGMDSLMTVTVIRRIGGSLGYDLLPTEFRDNPTLRALGNLLARKPLPQRTGTEGAA
ncbi:type I polyketide synthase [Saccharomonospora sp. NB11]|uniref:type I polyketide synthase n=1 Tax=Saccharomonospora sp. NB11 TaxID=1642298 RepID=UPI001E3CEED2|nr:type I polyketide synthase [Saccharomonospora sp. NB11]